MTSSLAFMVYLYIPLTCRFNFSFERALNVTVNHPPPHHRHYHSGQGVSVSDKGHSSQIIHHYLFFYPKYPKFEFLPSLQIPAISACGIIHHYLFFYPKYPKFEFLPSLQIPAISACGVNLHSGRTSHGICVCIWMYNVDHSLKIWIILSMFKIVANDMPWENRNLF